MSGGLRRRRRRRGTEDPFVRGEWLGGWSARRGNRSWQNKYFLAWREVETRDNPARGRKSSLLKMNACPDSGDEGDFGLGRGVSCGRTECGGWPVEGLRTHSLSLYNSEEKIMILTRGFLSSR